MITYASKLDLDKLVEEATRLPFPINDGSGAQMLRTQGDGLPPRFHINYPEMTKAISEIKSFRNIEPLHLMVNKLPAGIEVPRHRDFLPRTKKQANRNYPCLERWHLPIITNEHCAWWDQDGGTIQMFPGIWYGPLPYWKEHQVWNKGTTERVHLVIDLDSDCVGRYDEDTM